MKANLVCEVDVEGTEGMMTRGEKRDNSDKRMVRVGINK
jgi:hypothetical protein